MQKGLTVISAFALSIGFSLGLNMGCRVALGETVASAPANTSNLKNRNFYEVLDDLLKDFELDLKSGTVTGLKNLSIRNIAISENIPPSFKSHLELLVTEKIIKNAKSRIIQCLTCRSRKATLSGNQMVITSAESNPVELSRIAKISGIDNFLDIAFTYQTTGMLLSMYITDPESGAVTWSRTYNSESSRASMVRQGVDFSQVDESKRETEYSPLVQSRFSLNFISEPNLVSRSQCLALGFRMMERYDNRRKEVGFELNYMIDASTITNSSSTADTNRLYNSFTLNMTLLFMHAWTFMGEEENYNRIRGSVVLGLGGTYASGYVGALVRGGYEWRLAKHYAVSVLLGYRPTATVFISNGEAGQITGLEYGLGINYLF